MGITWQMAKTMMLHAASPAYDWGYAVNFAVYIINNNRQTANRGYTATDLWNEGGPDRRMNMRKGVFGCLGYAKEYNKRKDKPRAKPVIFLGIDEAAKAYIVRDISQGIASFA